MPRCISYIRTGISAEAWTRCTRRAAAGTRFCRSHENALNGAVLGLWVNGFPERAGVRTAIAVKDGATAKPGK
jgi:hypothetical protein